MGGGIGQHGQPPDLTGCERGAGAAGLAKGALKSMGLRLKRQNVS